MTIERFNVVLLGSTLGGQDVAKVAKELANLIKRDTEFATRLLRGLPTKLKSGVDTATGVRYLEALERIGVAARLEPETLEVDAGLGSTTEGRRARDEGTDISGRSNVRTATAAMQGQSRGSGVMQAGKTRRAVWLIIGGVILTTLAIAMIGRHVGGAAGKLAAIDKTASLARDAGMPDGIFGVRFLQDLSDVRRIRPAVSQLPTGQWVENADWRGYPALVIYQFDDANKYLLMITLNLQIQGNVDTFTAINGELASLYGPLSPRAPRDDEKLYAERHAGGIGLFHRLFSAPDGQVVEQIAWYKQKGTSNEETPASAGTAAPSKQSEASQRVPERAFDQAIEGPAPRSAIPAPVSPPMQAQSSYIEDRFLRDPVIFDRTNYTFESPRLNHVTLSLSSPSISYPEIRAAAFLKFPYLNDNGPFNDSLMAWYAVIATARNPNSEGDGMALLYAVELVVDAKEHGNLVCRADGFDIYPEARRLEAIRLLRKGPNMVGWGRRCEPA